MAPQGLRVVAVANFIVAFSLLLAHGIVSHSPLPATGLMPLFFSSSFSLFILQRCAPRAPALASSLGADSERQPLLPSETAHNATPAVGTATTPFEAGNASTPEERDGDEGSRDIHNRFPILVFACDVVLAGAIMTELVFTWLHSSEQSGQLAMLAAYGTIPLLGNFLIHLLFAVRGFSSGLALPELTRYIAWQLVPGDCPDCGHHLRPDHWPDVPWFQSLGRTVRSARERQWMFPALPEAARPGIPEWLKWPSRDREGEGEAGQHGALGGPDAGAEPGRMSRIPQWLRRPTWLSDSGMDERQRDIKDGHEEEAPLFVDRNTSTYRDEEDVWEGAARRDRPGLYGAAAGSAEEVVVIGKKKQRKIASSEDVEEE